MAISDAVPFVGATDRTIDKWLKDRIVEPDVDASKGQSRKLSKITIFALAMVANLRAKNIGNLEFASELAKLIQSHTEQDLLAKFAKGQRYVVMVENKCIPDLLAQRVAFDEQMKKMAAEAGICPIVINLEVSWKSLCQKLDAMVAPKRKDA